ncbi:Glycosyltransferase involved in cell wall bisynthesis [Alteromonadaceae bacterium Bs31]|nr:Glycosyltransferase involved in cell wall bisynthesis [Alteromonadaceae bacterium Bs31]
MTVSVVIPAKNEQQGLAQLLPDLIKIENLDEIIVVDDGSEDETKKICQEYGVTVISHPYSIGNGAAIKTGARKAKGDVIVFMDADGQHSARDVPRLIEEYKKGYCMVVGARSRKSQASIGRWFANTFYNLFASWITGRKVRDLTSGFRVVNAQKFREFLSLLPNGFSYPTTSTMAFFRAGYSVAYVPIEVAKREGNSHLRIWKDGVRFLLIIFKVGTLYSPLKVFLPMSLAVFSTGLGYYIFTYLVSGRFTNMSALLFTTSLLIFMMGLISEQITSLIYSQK